MSENVTVLGSFVVDLMTRASHIPVPGETVKGNFFLMGPGGKGSNQAIAAHRCGGKVTLITKIGKDLFSKVATDFYTQEGIDQTYIFHDPSYSTGIALISVAESSSENAITVVPGACASITEEEIERTYPVLDETDVLVCQLETNLNIIPQAVRRVQSKGGLALLNPAPAQEKIEDSFIGMFDFITPNETEASILSGITVIDKQTAYMAASELQNKGVRNVLITMGENGCFLLSENGESLLFPSFPVQVVDTTGAGDAFNGGLATALSKGKSLKDSIVFATMVASLSVTKIGTAPAMPSASEVNAFLHKINMEDYWDTVH
jgi:ribokinase